MKDQHLGVPVEATVGLSGAPLRSGPVDQAPPIPNAVSQKERPILFSGAMVRAILEGRKTQTRRIVKVQPEDFGGFGEPRWWMPDPHEISRPKDEEEYRRVAIERCPYGKPGDRLWVRETWREVDTLNHIVIYKSEDREADLQSFLDGQRMWKPSIFMPRWASRITLEVVSVRVERLQDITEADAIAEGVWDGEPVWPPNKDLCPVCHGQCVYEGGSMSGAIERDCTHCDTNVKRYKALWQHINGGDSWDANPWVWVVEFSCVSGSEGERSEVPAQRNGTPETRGGAAETPNNTTP